MALQQNHWRIIAECNVALEGKAGISFVLAFPRFDLVDWHYQRIWKHWFPSGKTTKRWWLLMPVGCWAILNGGTALLRRRCLPSFMGSSIWAITSEDWPSSIKMASKLQWTWRSGDQVTWVIGAVCLQDWVLPWEELKRLNGDILSRTLLAVVVKLVRWPRLIQLTVLTEHGFEDIARKSFNIENFINLLLYLGIVLLVYKKLGGHWLHFEDMVSESTRLSWQISARQSIWPQLLLVQKYTCNNRITGDKILLTDCRCRMVYLIDSGRLWMVAELALLQIMLPRYLVSEVLSALHYASSAGLPSVVVQAWPAV